MTTARATQHVPHPKMNRTEAAYADHLTMRQHAGEIVEWWFEGVKFWLGHNTCFYTPDFMVMMAGGGIEIHEVKGFWRDDARVKIKAASAKYPFRFIAVTKHKGGTWRYETFGRDD